MNLLDFMALLIIARVCGANWPGHHKEVWKRDVARQGIKQGFGSKVTSSRYPALL